MIYLKEVETNIMTIDATFWVAVSFVIFFKALVDSSSGQETLIMSAPASSSSLICLIVPLWSVVRVFVIDCTEITESPPTSMFPTFIFVVFFLLISL